MHLSKIEILNLWGKDKIQLEFDKRVTFLTGVNGTGKSSLLNVIYDVLNIGNEGKVPSTSKSRFWSALAEFDNDVQTQFMLAPLSDSDSIISKIENLKCKKDGYHNLDLLHKIEDLFKNQNNEKVLNHVSYSKNIEGEVGSSAFKVPRDMNSEDESELNDYLTARPRGFLFQDDRTTLHDMESTKIDFSSDYWGIYGSLIDIRFSYIQHAIKKFENKINKNIADEFSKLKATEVSSYLTSKVYLENNAKLSGLKEITHSLNKYFSTSGKEIEKDDNENWTLKNINSGQVISWHLLSRGEKTLIYLFLSVFLYKDKVDVFLLDEPEISLHVKWQKNLITDLTELAPNNQFIIATHSPSLVKHGWLGNCLELSI